VERAISSVSDQMCIVTHLGIIDIVDFIKDDELDISDEIGSFVQHAPENLRGHDQTWGFRVNLYVACENSNSGRCGGGAGEGRFEVAEFLIREGFDRRCIDCTETSQQCDVRIIGAAYRVICFIARAMAYSATTVLPAEVCAATNTGSPISRWYTASF
jgi:hypothetical protein